MLLLTVLYAMAVRYGATAAGQQRCDFNQETKINECLQVLGFVELINN